MRWKKTLKITVSCKLKTTKERESVFSFFQIMDTNSRHVSEYEKLDRDDTTKTKSTYSPETQKEINQSITNKALSWGQKKYSLDPTCNRFLLLEIEGLTSSFSTTGSSLTSKIETVLQTTASTAFTVGTEFPASAITPSSIGTE